jgi:hypothetical protein
MRKIYPFAVAILVIALILTACAPPAVSVDQQAKIAVPTRTPQQVAQAETAVPPTAVPTNVPTAEPPTAVPPTAVPTDPPTPEPTAEPTAEPELGYVAPAPLEELMAVRGVVPSAPDTTDEPKWWTVNGERLWESPYELSGDLMNDPDSHLTGIVYITVSPGGSYEGEWLYQSVEMQFEGFKGPISYNAYVYGLQDHALGKYVYEGYGIWATGGGLIDMSYEGEEEACVGVRNAAFVPERVMTIKLINPNKNGNAIFHFGGWLPGQTPPECGPADQADNVFLEAVADTGLYVPKPEKNPITAEDIYATGFGLLENTLAIEAAIMAEVDELEPVIVNGVDLAPYLPIMDPNGGVKNLLTWGNFGGWGADIPANAIVTDTFRYMTWNVEGGIWDSVFGMTTNGFLERHDGVLLRVAGGNAVINATLIYPDGTSQRCEAVESIGVFRGLTVNLEVVNADSENAAVLQQIPWGREDAPRNVPAVCSYDPAKLAP